MAGRHHNIRGRGAWAVACRAPPRARNLLYFNVKACYHLSGGGARAVPARRLRDVWLSGCRGGVMARVFRRTFPALIVAPLVILLTAVTAAAQSVSGSV